MKNLFIILIAFSLVGCMASKEIRQAKRCNKKLEKVLAKCPDLQKIDTIQVPFTVIVPEIQIKDSLTIQIDTLELLKYVEISKIKYITKAFSIDSLKLDSNYRLQIRLINGLLTYNLIIYQDTVKSVVDVPIKVIAPIKITLLDRAWTFLKTFWLLFIVAGLILFAFKFS